jgi:arginine/ornithine transport system permease protein
VARDVYANHLLPAEAFGTAAVIYFTLTFSMVGAFKLLERRFMRHLQTERRPGATATPLAPHPARPA